MKHTLEFGGREISFDASEQDAQVITRIITGLIDGMGFVNLEADDVKAIIDGAESLAVGEGTASGENRCADAANEAMKNIKGAKKLLVSVASGADVTLAEMVGAAMAVQEVSERGLAIP